MISWPPPLPTRRRKRKNSRKKKPEYNNDSNRLHKTIGWLILLGSVIYFFTFSDYWQMILKRVGDTGSIW